MYYDLQKFRQSATLVCLLGALSPLSLSAAPLTEAEALRLSMNRPQLGELAKARLGEAEADIAEAAVWANPSLELSRDKTGNERETAWKLSQSLDFSGRRALRQQAADQRLSATQAELQAQSGERSGEVRRAFYTLLHQQEALHAIKTWAARFSIIDEAISKLAKAGEASGYDRRRMARERQSAEAKLAEARANIERARVHLSTLTAQTIDEELSGVLLPTPPTDFALLQASITQRPDLIALWARSEAAHADNAAARRLFPEVELSLGSKQINDGPTRASGTMLSLSIPLPLFDRAQGAERRSAAQALAARAEYALQKQKAEGEIAGAYRQLTQLISAAERYRSQAVQPSSDLVRIAETAYRAGESSLLELLDAYKGALEAETTALELELKAREAHIELNQLTGNF